VFCVAGKRIVPKVYDKRLRIFIGFTALVASILVLRLMQMQLLSGSSVQEQLAELKRQKSQSRQLMTLRGKILDRKGRILATDEPHFQLHISYKLTCFYDQRVRRALEIAASKKDNPETALAITAKLDDIEQIIEKCTRFGTTRRQIEEKITNINNKIWNLRTFLAWVRSGPDPNILEKYDNKINSIPPSKAVAAFERKFPDESDRLLRIIKVVDVVGMSSMLPLLELKTDDDLFAAQVEFMDINDIQIMPIAQRYYPYGSVASQTIGWVGPATQDRDKRLFENDRLANYLEGEVCGREDGIEYVCEPILRGRRGELVYDIDRRLINQTETQFGTDISLTLDIELQKRIEQYLTDPRRNPNSKSPTAAVVIDVGSGGILALVSVPVFDLNIARNEYGNIRNDPNNPLLNRALFQQYPPGSVVKPVILIAALETGQVTANEIIACPAHVAPTGWPNCWIYRQNNRGHSDIWPNNAHNAIKGSCNIYFSHIADRLDSVVLQNWLFRFGYGRQLDLACPDLFAASLANANDLDTEHRKFRQYQGQISSIPVPADTIVSSFEQIPSLRDDEKRLFGIGHGNLRATPLQVANSFAAIARGGIYKQPCLFLTNQSSATTTSTPNALTTNTDVDLRISPQTMQVVSEGMAAVAGESGGTAYEIFAYSGFSRQGIRVFGKTGSTEKPEHAWFAGFAQDNNGRKLALAVIVEGGRHGAEDAAPPAREIIQFCIESGYIGRNATN
jgi:penicillin-binding protein 2